MATSAPPTSNPAVALSPEDARVILRKHVLVGGTYWDGERRTTYATCECGTRCYLVKQHPDHADHLVSLLFPSASESTAQETGR